MVAGVEFVPMHAEEQGRGGHASAVGPLKRILSGYIDRHGKPLTDCVVATIPGRGWDLEREDFAAVRWASALLFLASWSGNDYYPRFGGKYVSSSNFRVMGQAFTGSTPTHVAISARRRDGRAMDGGYEHGAIKFSLPVQISVRELTSIDEAFVAGLDAAQLAGSAVIDRLRTALPFVELANTDDEFMTEHAEAILMGSAFEQVLVGRASSYKLGRNFGELFRQFGKVKLEGARRVRPGIEIDTSNPEIAAAQPMWWVHRKWMEELYDVRSKVVHKGEQAGRSWGWSIQEHLVMGAHVFPLVVKLLLEQEKLYTLTDKDRTACLATDRLLAEPRWVEDSDAEEHERSWPDIIAKAQCDVLTAKIMKKYVTEPEES